jgi:hypothetical protein
LPFNKHQVLFTIKWHDADCKEHSFQNKYKIDDLEWQDNHCSVIMPGGSFIKYDEVGGPFLPQHWGLTRRAC